MVGMGLRGARPLAKAGPAAYGGRERIATMTKDDIRLATIILAVVLGLMVLPRLLGLVFAAFDSEPASVVEPPVRNAPAPGTTPRERQEARQEAAADAVRAAVPLEALIVRVDNTTPDPLAPLRWKKRVLVIFAPSPQDPRLKRQLDLLREAPSLLAERDVAVVIDADPAAPSRLREIYRPVDFTFVLIDKAGEQALRKPVPWAVDDLATFIDSLPLRQQEVAERRRGN